MGRPMVSSNAVRQQVAAAKGALARTLNATLPSSKGSRRGVRFGPDVDNSEKEDVKNITQCLSNGRHVILEPARSSPELGHLRGCKAKVVDSMVDCRGAVTYSVEIADTKEVLQVPAYWVRPDGIVINGSLDVDFLPLEEVLQLTTTLRVPVFQRRYCWAEAHWLELWESVLETLKDGINERQPFRSQSHSLGRLLLFSQADGSILILDGQQRLTTTCVLLAALRERLLSLQDNASASQLSALLMNDAGQHRLVPTLDDRDDFHQVLVQRSPAGCSALLSAKRFFTTMVEALDLEACTRFAEAVRYRMMAIAFFLRDQESLQSVFENLTLQARLGPGGVELSPLDLIRNFVLEHFSDEVGMRGAHASFWSPMEKLAATPDGLSQAFCTFLSCSPEELYACFIHWWKAEPADVVTEEEATERLRILLAHVTQTMRPSKCL